MIENKDKLTDMALRIISQGPAVTYVAEASGDYAPLFISSNIRSQLGYSQEEFLADPGFWVKHIHPDDKERVLNEMTSVFKTNVHVYEYRFKHKDGSYKWMHDESVLIRDDAGNPLEVVGFWRDVSEAKQTEEALHESEEQYRSLVTNIPGVVYRCELDPDWTVRYISEAIEDLAGYPASDFIEAARSYASIIHPDDRQRVENEVFTAVERKQAFALEYRIIDSNGGDRWVYEKGQAAIDADGKPLWLDGVIIDVTEKKQAEHQLVEAKEQAEEANQVKSQFLSRMTHELRTPLNSILGFAQIMDMSDDNETIRNHRNSIKTITNSGWHLLRIIDDMLNLSAIEANKVDLNIENVGIERCILDYINIMSPLAHERDVILNYSETTSEDRIVRADPFRLKQVLLNLIANGVKYNREGGSVTINCQSTHPERIRIEVSDTGPGIPDNDIPSLFQPFSRLHERAYSVQGAGIGLSVAKQLIELMDGTIGVESVYGQGSTFWVELPAATESTATKPESPEKIPVESFGTYTLLYIEDNPSHIKLFDAMIELMPDIRLLTAHTPGLGLELANAHLPDIMVLDICLPGMNGYEVLEQLQANKATSKIPVIAVSASAMPVDIEKGLRAGFRRYLTKPINVTEFRKAVNEILRDSVS